jgi:hypothetical protein
MVLKIMMRAAVHTAKANMAIPEIMLMALRFFLANRYLSAIKYWAFMLDFNCKVSG